MISPTRNQPTNQSGFSLIELLVSLVILSSIMVFLGIGIRLLARASDANADKIEQLDMHARAYDIWKRDARNLLRTFADAADDTKRYLFSGSPDELVFTALEPPFPTHSAVYFMRYSIHRGEGETTVLRERARYRKGMTEFPGATPANQVVLLDRQKNATLLYGDIGPEGLIWSDNWTAQDKLPDLLRLRVQPGGKRPSEDIDMIVRLRADAELECLIGTTLFCSARTKGVLRRFKTSAADNTGKQDKEPEQQQQDQKEGEGE